MIEEGKEYKITLDSIKELKARGGLPKPENEAWLDKAKAENDLIFFKEHKEVVEEKYGFSFGDKLNIAIYPYRVVLSEEQELEYKEDVREFFSLSKEVGDSIHGIPLEELSEEQGELYSLVLNTNLNH